MAGSLTQSHTQRLEALRRVRHVLQGEAGEISLLKRDASTGALIELLSIDRSWTYGDRDAGGRALPPNVMFELMIAEELVTAADVRQTWAIRHGAQIFQIAQVSPGEPGTFPPSGLNRFWRFWIAPLEEVA